MQRKFTKFRSSVTFFIKIYRNQWIIRGLWPASTDLDFLNCIQYDGKDPNCNVAYAYNESLFTGPLKNDLNKYWTEIDVSNDLKSN